MMLNSFVFKTIQHHLNIHFKELLRIFKCLETNDTILSTILADCLDGDTFTERQCRLSTRFGRLSKRFIRLFNVHRRKMIVIVIHIAQVLNQLNDCS